MVQTRAKTKAAQGIEKPCATSERTAMRPAFYVGQPGFGAHELLYMTHSTKTITRIKLWWLFFVLAEPVIQQLKDYREK